MQGVETFLTLVFGQIADWLERLSAAVGNSIPFHRESLEAPFFEKTTDRKPIQSIQSIFPSLKRSRCAGPSPAKFPCKLFSF